MDRRTRRGVAAVCLVGMLATATLTGCANVKVRKVDVQDRINGTDDRVKGFRYYLTRPYLVLPQKISLSREYIPVALAIYPASAAEPTPEQPISKDAVLCLVASVPNRQRTYQVYDAEGHPLEIPATEVRILRTKPGKSGADKLSRDQAVGKIKETIRPKAVKVLTDAGLYKKDEDNTQIDIAIGNAIDKETMFIGELSKDIRAGVKVGVAAAINAVNQYLDKKKKNLALPATETVDKITGEILDSLPKSPGAAGPAPSGGALAAVKTDPKPTTDTGGGQTPDNKPAGGAAVEPVQLVFLPDFEEQYAISNVNVLAKTKYRYTFRNGTDLETFSGSYNATDVPVKIVETVGALITAVGEVAKTRLSALPVQGAKLTVTVGNEVPDADFYLRLEQAIEPGVYRVEKSWERATAAPLTDLSGDRIKGLFADIGLPVVTSAAVINAADHTKETNLPPAAPSGK